MVEINNQTITLSALQFREIKNSGTKPVHEARTENFSPHTPKRDKIKYVVKREKEKEKKKIGSQWKNRNGWN